MDGDGHLPYTLIRDLPETDRPRERLQHAGAAALSNSELLAILLRTGGAKESALAQASRLLGRFGGLSGLRTAPFIELCGEHGIGEAKAAQIKAALELGTRLSAFSPETKPQVRTPDDVASLVLTEMSLLTEEHVRVMLLDARNRVLGAPTVYVGSAHTASVRIAELLSEPIKVKATAIVLLHNHPSGDPVPSAADTHMTRRLFDAAQLMGIDLFDHLVIGGGRYVSMRQVKLGFPDHAK